MNENSLRAALYCRISVADKKVNKVENQEAQLRELADREGYTVVEVYTDDGISAANVDKTRPAFLRLIEDVKAGKYDVVLATEQSRLERQAGDYITIEHAFSSAGVLMHLLGSAPVDLDNEDDAFMGGLRSLLNTKEVKQLKKRLHNRYNIERGKGLGLWHVRPFGFKESRKPGDRNADPETLKPEIKEDEAKALRDAYDLIMAGSTLYEITKLWNDTGIRTTMEGKPRKRRGSDDVMISNGLWNTSTLRQVLVRPLNAGIKISLGKVVSTTYPQIFTVDELEALKNKLKNDKPTIKRGPKATTLLTGIIRCNCGASMTIGHQGNAKYKYDVYRCPPNAPQTGSKHTTITRSSADQLARSAVISALLRHEADSLPGGKQASRLIAIESELAAVREQLVAMNASMAEAMTVPGFSAIPFHAMGATLTAREQALVDERENINLENAQASLLVEARKFLYAPGTVSLTVAQEVQREVGKRFDNLPLNERRNLVRTLITMTVRESKGTQKRLNRVHLVHKIAKSLNPDDNEFTAEEVDRWDAETLKQLASSN